MVDGASRTPGVPAYGSSCEHCAAGTHSTPAGDGKDIGRLAHLYVCQGLSTYAIGEITGLDRQRVTRMLRQGGVPLRPRGAGLGRDRTGPCSLRRPADLGGPAGAQHRQGAARRPHLATIPLLSRLPRPWWKTCTGDRGPACITSSS